MSRRAGPEWIKPRGLSVIRSGPTTTSCAVSLSPYEPTPGTIDLIPPIVSSGYSSPVGEAHIEMSGLP